MAQQEEGWPLGLQPLNVRVGIPRNRHLNASLSFNTSSPLSSSDSSSDLDTESTGSFFHERSTTLGRLIGISSILQLSRRSSTRGRISSPVRNKKNSSSSSYNRRTWFLSLCSRLSTDAAAMNSAAAPSLAHFLEAERRATARSPGPGGCGPDDFSRVLNGPNSLFIGGHVAPPQSSDCGREMLAREGRDGPPLLLSCLCGNIAHS